MKTLVYLLSLCVLLSVSHSYAALPPLAQELRELKTIIDDERLYQTLSGANEIKTIEKVDNGYLFVTDKGRLLVNIVYSSAPKIGPAEFQVHFNSINEVQ